MNDLRSHSEYLALLRGVLERPEDDSPRLIISDWLEESGQEDRAKNIRQMCKKHDRSIEWDSRQLIASEGGTMPNWFHKWSQEQMICEMGFRVDRGFISEIRITSAEYMRHAKVFFNTHPITSVRLTDKRGYNYGTTWYRGDQSWQFSDPESDLPHELFSNLPNSNRRSYVSYDTEADALAALSRACVSYGRELAGLPSLNTKP